MKSPSRSIWISLLLVVIAFTTGRWLTPSHKTEANHQEPPTTHHESATSRWTCSMHPQIQQSEPGTCPICGMDLIPVEMEVQDEPGPRDMRMSERARALAEIRTEAVRRDFPTAQINLVGKLGYDETREASLTARFPARIDELFVNYIGIRVEKGEHLAKIYSPELFSAQRELLTAYRSDPNSVMTRAAKEKLRLWDLLPDQVDTILEQGNPSDQFEMRAPITGVVVSKLVKQGDYVKTGEPLFRIVDLSELWLTLEAYESDLIWLRYGQQVTFTVEAFPGETFQGQIAFIAPEVDTQTRSVSIRVNVPNQEGRLKPGMFAKGVVEVKMGAGGVVYAPELAGKWISPMHPEVVKDGPGQCDVCGMDLVPAESLGYVELTEPMAPLIIPASAALRTGKRAVVYVEKPDMDQPTYEGREVVLGPRAGDMFIVESGLDEGERVVTKGAFKIDSALQIQAKPSMMNPEHENPKATEPVPLNESPRLMEAYLALQAALAADDLDTAKDAVTAMMDIAGHAGALPKLLHKMMAAETLDELRKPHFELLSNAMITEAKAHPESFNGPLFLMHCPMVYRDRGADWLQRNKPLQNPYFGASMLHCGEVQETIGESSSGGDGHDH